jgi:hypothetical protein
VEEAVIVLGTDRLRALVELWSRHPEAWDALDVSTEAVVGRATKD